MIDGKIILLGILFLLAAALDWIQFKEELKEMWDEKPKAGTKKDEQRKNDDTGAAQQDC